MATFLMLLGGPDHHDRWDRLPDDDKQQAYADFNAFAKATAELATMLPRLFAVDIRPTLGVEIR